MKNKLIVTIVSSTIISLVVYIFLQNGDTSFDFESYTKVDINYKECILQSNPSESSSSICEFVITNLTKTPFVIVDVAIDNVKDIDFLDTKIKKLVQKDSSTTIRVKINNTEKATYNREITLICNANKGSLSLKVKAE